MIEPAAIAPSARGARRRRAVGSVAMRATIRTSWSGEGPGPVNNG
jgi:hypothetical protein